MDPQKKEMLQRHLTQAEQHIETGRAEVVKQRRIIEDLERDGHDATEARKLLATFEEILRQHFANRDLILGEFKKF